MDKSVDMLVRDRALYQPGTLAVRADDAELTYAELVRRAERLTRALRAAGVGPEVPAALCLPRSATLAVAALGVLGAEAPYVALDPTHPPARLRGIVTESGARALVADSVAFEPPPGVILIRPADLLDDEGNAQPEPLRQPADPGRRPHAEQAAYIIYTSGSTGRPKGVVVAHAPLRRLVDWHRHAFTLTADDRVAQVASPGFDAYVWELWGTLCAGASLHVPDDRTRVAPTELRDWLVRERITVAFIPTGLAEAVLALDWPADAALRLMLTGGDALHRRPSSTLPFAVVNNYGLTEAAVVSTSGTVAADENTVPSIGTAIDHAAAYIVDEKLQPVAAGEQGLLLLGGTGLARGYLGLAGLTAQRFVADHLGPRPGARLLCTGDLARRRPNGEIEFLGRSDEQISRLGVRVEPAEIAAALIRHPAMRAAVVVAETGEGPTRRLLAYVVAEGERPEDAALEEFAKSLLPAPMLPNQYVWLDELPLNGNGKVDRSRLPDPPNPAATPPSIGPAPTGELAQALIPVVAEVLGRTSIPADANFFQLGGHSMLGAQLIIRLRELYPADLSLQFLFDHPTVQKMADGIGELLGREALPTGQADATAGPGAP